MPKPNPMQVRELLLQALAHERGGTLVYSTALECAVNDDLREEWEKYLEQTVRHVDILTGVCVAMGLDRGRDDARLPDRPSQRQGPRDRDEDGAAPTATPRLRSSSHAIASCSRRRRTTPIGS